eukprot:425991_1
MSQSKKCLCEICTCGKHLCEICKPNLPFLHKTKEIYKSPPFTAKTNYQTEFQPKPIEKRQVIEAEEYRRNKIKFVAKSSYQEEFIPKPLPKPVEYQDEEYIANSTKFDAQSSYNTDYIEYQFKQCTCPVVAQSLDTGKAAPDHQYFVQHGHKWRACKPKSD